MFPFQGNNSVFMEFHINMDIKSVKGSLKVCTVIILHKVWQSFTKLVAEQPDNISIIDHIYSYHSVQQYFA